jgi:hypothetical protein
MLMIVLDATIVNVALPSIQEDLGSILGYDALQVGLAYLPLTVVMGTMSFRITGQLNLRSRRRRFELSRCRATRRPQARAARRPGCGW